MKYFYKDMAGSLKLTDLEQSPPALIQEIYV